MGTRTTLMNVTSTSIDQIMVNMNDISNKGNPRRNGPRLVRMDIAT
jgi:hypothetical protein